jgi:uncharacterized protein (TIGR02996 family)
MTPDEAFLEDVREHPEEDAPRLVYADWLDDHGDPERAEFIRLKCELARLPAEDARRPALEARARALLASHQATWTAPLRGRVQGWAFRRGLVEKVKVRAGAFLAHAPDLFRVAPIREVEVRGARGQLPALLACPHLARVAILDLHSNRLDAGDAGLLAGSPRLGGLSGLVLHSNELGGAGVRGLASSPHLAGLATLNLTRNRLDPAGVRGCPESRVFGLKTPENQGTFSLSG